MPSAFTAAMRLAGPALNVALIFSMRPDAGSFTHRSRGTDSSDGFPSPVRSTMIESVRLPDGSPPPMNAPALGSSAEMPSRESDPTISQLVPRPAPDDSTDD